MGRAIYVDFKDTLPHRKHISAADLDKATGGWVKEGDILIIDSSYKIDPFTPDTNTDKDQRLLVNGETAQWCVDHKIKCVGFGDGVSIENCNEDVKPFHDICMAEMPRAYICYGDRDIFNYTIHKEYTDKGYRSQHYIFKYKEYYFEVQVRTIAEEVYAEFDHYVKYPYRENNHFLKRYTSVVAELLNSVDEIISTCFQFGEEGWFDMEKYFAQDSYNDLERMSKEPHKREQEQIPRAKDGVIDAGSYMNRMILRKG